MKLVFDIETTHCAPTLIEAGLDLENAYRYAKQRDMPEGLTAGEQAAWLNDQFTSSAALTPEFGRVVSIAYKIAGEKEVQKLYIGAEADTLGAVHEAEGIILKNFAQLFQSGNSVQLVGHNILRFDLPYLWTRFAAHGIEIPGQLRLYGVKPWEVTIQDTYTIWKQSQFSTCQAGNLATLCAVLGIPSPKQGITGSQVPKVFWSEPSRRDEISDYCAEDVEATAQVYNRLKQLKFA